MKVIERLSSEVEPPNKDKVKLCVGQRRRIPDGRCTRRPYLTSGPVAYCLQAKAPSDSGWDIRNSGLNV